MTTLVTPSSTPPAFQRITWRENVAPHWRFGTLLTGAFTVAWGWDLLVYAISHTKANENPLRNQIGFANVQASQYLVVIVLQYLLVCAAAAWGSSLLRGGSGNITTTSPTTTATATTNTNTSSLALAPPPPPPTWHEPAIRAVEFLPSPIFAGKLMAYLAQFGKLSAFRRGWLNLAATAGAAVLAHTLPMDIGTRIHASLYRFTAIVQETLGFGLGIAWNVLLGQVLGPKPQQHKKSDEDDGINLVGIVVRAGYLLVVLLLALRVTALQNKYRNYNASDENNNMSSFWERQYGLMTFAMQVVCAFTLVDFWDDIFSAAWYGRVEAVAVLLVLSGVLSAVVASVDLDVLRARQREHLDEIEEEGTSSGPGWALCALLLPCVWCCCPWVPVLVLLTNTADSNDTLKEDWYQLIAMVCGLAASIEASNLVVTLTDTLAAGFCTASHCTSPVLFCLWQGLVATILTATLIPTLGKFCVVKQVTGEGSAGTTADEKRPLLSV